MLMNMKDLLTVAQKNHFAVPAFNIGSDQLLKAVMKTVKELKSPVILEMSPDEFNFVDDMQFFYYFGKQLLGIYKDPFRKKQDYFLRKNLHSKAIGRRMIAAMQDNMMRMACLMRAMGPNVAGVIGTAVAAGCFMAIFGI